jgi:hypothetical protein
MSRQTAQLQLSGGGVMKTSAGCPMVVNTSVLHNNDRAMTGNLDSKIISIDSYLQVEMAGKFSTFMYLFLCTSSTIGSLIGRSTKIEVWGLKARDPAIFREF